ncbi:MAG: YtxH domain-containing protein [Nitrospirales bacterium]
MTNHSHENNQNDIPLDGAVESSRFGIGLLIGLLSGAIFGGLAGAGTMLLLAPQSGKRTRAKLQRQGLKLRHQATESIEDALANVSDKAHAYSDDLQKEVGKVEQRGQAILDEQKDNLAAIVKAGKNAVQGSRS